ncbi:MAG: heme exporter protein CcmB [Actinomycetota bacterium]|jgi:heme exporter protein B|uniref:heme exporter protein CcmB n=1 Tax=uncultured Ilumatobacter sp. TaxID=879968 RepID=UPI00374E57A2|nr:heme exporter protein CcmB [Actinomycetota bacterium]
MSSWRVARLIAAKDLRVERRSKIVTNQVLPFAGITMVSFAFALDKQNVLDTVAPGLVWLATTFSLLILVQRSFSIETDDGALDAMRVAGIDARAIFLGKAMALAVQLLVLEILLLFAAVVLYGESIQSSGAVLAFFDTPITVGGVEVLLSGESTGAQSPVLAGVLLVTTLICATCGLAAVGTLYGGLAAGFKGSETLLPLLALPAVAPVLIGATKAVESAVGTAGAVVSEGWQWVGLLAVFAVAFGIGGALAFGPLIDE